MWQKNTHNLDTHDGTKELVIWWLVTLKDRQETLSNLDCFADRYFQIKVQDKET